MIKQLIHLKDIIIINVYYPNYRSFKAHELKIDKPKGDKTVIEDFNTPLSATNEQWTKK